MSGVGGRGLFITFEGGDGVGKTTQSALLAEHLGLTGSPCVVTREPGGTPLGATLREALLHGETRPAPRVEAMLFAADRGHHVASMIRPALEAGTSVICDRYTDSSIAYQGGGRDLSEDDVRFLSSWVTGGLVPDLTILLDLDPVEGRRRRGGTNDAIESEADEFHERVRQTFLRLAALEPERFLVLDATLDHQSIHQAITARVESLMAADSSSTSTKPTPETLAESFGGC